jgi:hypothetical protein
MPIDKYFDKFPVISYSNTQAIDITRRVAIIESVSKNPFIFYPYEITDDERPDQLSTRYYKDPFKSWMIYLTNKVIDPYYEWYLTQNQFEDFLSLKYRSLENAFEKIKCYRNNWIESENISLSRYDSLTDVLRSYWEPVYGAHNKIIAYSRKQKDWTINTNRIVKYEVSNNDLKQNEVCKIVFDEDTVGSGQVLMTSSNTLFLHHTSGSYVSSNTVHITSNSYILGKESNSNTSFTSSTVQIENLRPEEEVYWKPVFMIDIETEKNEFNKTIRLIDSNYSQDVVKNFRSLMKQ